TPSIPLGYPWHADKDWQLPAGERWIPYKITLPMKGRELTALADLEGGENLKLVYTPQRLEHEYYSPKEGRQFEAESHVAGGPYHVTAFVPERFGNRVDFSVAIQHNQASAHLFSG